MRNKKQQIEETIINAIKTKLLNYKPETKSMPFHYRLLGKDRIALYSFIQSLNTTFGVSIFEPVAEKIAASKFSIVKSRFLLETLLEIKHKKLYRK
ncbi:TdeIII family type II restriction endonuclease [Fervidobacterium sp.]